MASTRWPLISKHLVAGHVLTVDFMKISLYIDNSLANLVFFSSRKSFSFFNESIRACVSVALALAFARDFWTAALFFALFSSYSLSIFGFLVFLVLGMSLWFQI